MHLRPACLLLSLIITTSSLSGIEIFLKNGDRLQGDLVVESDDHLTLRHPILGEIEIAPAWAWAWAWVGIPAIGGGPDRDARVHSAPRARGSSAAAAMAPRSHNGTLPPNLTISSYNLTISPYLT